MMKTKTLVLLVAVSLLALPGVAFAAKAVPAKKGDIAFTFGGYVKMEVIWDSTQVNKNLYSLIARNNDPNFHHGRLKFTAENTRMHFAIRGPEVFGAKTSGYIEWDFDNHANQTGWFSTNKARVGLRHAMFRLTWPQTELMLGTYWSMLTEEVPETANFGACTTAGFPFVREPQIRLTQKAKLGRGLLTASVAIAEPHNGLWGFAENAYTGGYGAESTETPKVEVRLKYDIDLWGKAAFWGKPRPFSIRIGG
ncbi:MAG: hypothetical protein JRI59_09385, partial [Deltaproteobacteria bacterium]|nr:hypothetical protein [Deltaproteobacteria bacterium]